MVRGAIPPTPPKGDDLMFIYHMHITDNQFHEEYNFEGQFEDHFEAARFMEENEAVGNVITMVAPFITEG